MQSIEKNIITIKEKINLAKKMGQEVGLIAISKYFPVNKIQEAINAGQNIFGENKVQEAKEKWPELKKQNPKIELHLVGHLQSNKTKDAVAIFDVIQTLDSIKLAKILQKEIIKQRRNLKIFIQVNIGREKQKNGIDPDEIGNFLEELKVLKEFDISCIMCIAPKDENPEKYFQEISSLAKKHNLKNISMGMSSDFETAIKNGSNFVRIGTAIFGSRDG